jgi:hypothetical protein
MCRCSPGYGCSTERLAPIQRRKPIGFGSSVRTGCGEHFRRSMLMAPGRDWVECSPIYIAAGQEATTASLGEVPVCCTRPRLDGGFIAVRPL